MASLENLPADQRAVLQLVLQRGRTYDEIARLLSIDRAAVRARALAAFDALGPQTRVPPERRALITDYLLGQLPPRVRTVTRDRLAESAIERAWARVLSAELAPIATGPLPDIPTEISRHAPVAAPAAASAPVPEPEAAPKAKRQSVLLRRSRRDREPRAPKPPRQPKAKREPRASRREREPRAAKPARERRAAKGEHEQPDGRRISRLGGAILLGGLVIVVVVAAIALLTKGSGTPRATSSSAARTPSTAPAAATSTTSTAASVVAQVNLTPPSGRGKAAGIAEVLRQGATKGIAIVAQHVTPNSTKPANAYAVWLYNSPADARILGFVNPGVGSNGRLSTAGALPSDASRFKQLVVTLETSGAPKTPGTIVLQGKLGGI
jgi:Sigma-70, region 4